jgi:hypothetical protein
MEYCGPNLHNAPTWPVRERAFLAGARRENARTRAIVDALLKVAEAAEKTVRVDVTDGCEYCSALWVREYENKLTKSALAELSQAVGE